MDQIKLLLNDIFKGRDSVFLVIDGFNQAGKTDFMFLLMEGLHKHKFGFEFGLNQELDYAPFEYDFITDMLTLEQRLVTLGRGKRYFYFLDELGKSAPRATPWGKINIELITKMEVKRKDKLSFGGCSIGDIDRRIVSPNYLDVYFKKVGLTTAKMHHLRRKTSSLIHNIPPTSVKFKEFTPALFTKEPKLANDTIVDVDMQNASNFARKVKYTGPLSKPSYYDSVRRGQIKWERLAQLGSKAYKLEVKQDETPN